MTQARVDPDAYIANFQARVLHDAWLEGTARYWLRRAKQFERARSGDHDDRRRGACRPQVSSAGAAARDAHLAEIAQACRNRAAFTHASSVELIESLLDWDPEEDAA